MIKMIVFLYNKHKNDKRVSDIAHLQTFSDLALIAMLPVFLILKLIKVDIILMIRNLGNLKVIEYCIGIIFIFFLYSVFYFIFPKNFLDRKFKEFTYDKYYLLYLRVVWISLSLICLALLLYN